MIDPFQAPADRLEQILLTYPDLKEKQDPHSMFLVSSIYDVVNDCLDDREKRFVSLRYFQGRSLLMTSIKLEVSERTAYQLRRSVLEKLFIGLGDAVVI